jgi:hypothetical protein
MKTLFRTSMVVGVALAFICLTAPLGHTQTLCAKCGTATLIAKCPPGVIKSDCADVKDFVRPNWSFDFRSGAIAVSPSKDSDLVYGLSPAWSNDGAPGENRVCAKCGVAFPLDSGIKKLANQP